MRRPARCKPGRFFLYQNPTQLWERKEKNMEPKEPPCRLNRIGPPLKPRKKLEPISTGNPFRR